MIDLTTPPTAEELTIWNKVRRATMARRHHPVTASIRSVRHAINLALDGAIVECGVWRGGCSMAMALAVPNGHKPKLYLFDTFCGMPEPTDIDGHRAKDTWHKNKTDAGNNFCRADLADVKRNMASTGYNDGLIDYVQGLVEQTIPDKAPDKIAVARLDTDWYASTKHLLENLYPRLQTGGVLIIDDYGAWQGCRQAVDEYFGNPKLQTIDKCGRLIIKENKCQH